MQILKLHEGNEFPFDWVNLKPYTNSLGYRKEIYLIDSEDYTADLTILFLNLFRDINDDIKVYDAAWWDLCLDTWNINDDVYDYSTNGKSEETAAYLNLLSQSSIPKDYTGSCTCSNWEVYLPVLIRCIINHNAPYSPLFYNSNSNFFFYFHHTGSIGLYFKEMNKAMVEILNKAEKNYEVVS